MVECMFCKHKVIGSNPIVSKYFTYISPSRTRTNYLMVNSHLLYLLSYQGSKSLSYKVNTALSSNKITVLFSRYRLTKKQNIFTYEY